MLKLLIENDNVSRANQSANYYITGTLITITFKISAIILMNVMKMLQISWRDLMMK